MANHPTPDSVVQTGLGFFASRTLLAAVELGLFGELSDEPLGEAALADRLDLHPRTSGEFLDALVALDVLERQDAVYRNSPAADRYLVPGEPTSLVPFLELAAERLYRSWVWLPELLRTGEPRTPAGEPESLFESIYDDPDRLERFLDAMGATSLGVGRELADAFPWAEYETVCDVGCAKGVVPVELARAHDHLDATGFDLPPVEPFFESYVADRGLADRVEFHAGDFFEQPLPEADVLVFGHVLFDWDEAGKRTLLAKAREALPGDGALVVYDPLFDAERREAYPLLMSLNLGLVTDGGRGYGPGEIREWLADAGFGTVRIDELSGRNSLVVAEP